MHPTYLGSTQTHKAANNKHKVLVKMWRKTNLLEPHVNWCSCCRTVWRSLKKVKNRVTIRSSNLTSGNMSEGSEITISKR